MSDSAFEEWWARYVLPSGRITADAVYAAWAASAATEREECAKIIDDNAEGSRGGERVLVPRTEGNLAGTGYADAIRNRQTAAI